VATISNAGAGGNCRDWLRLDALWPVWLASKPLMKLFQPNRIGVSRTGALWSQRPPAKCIKSDRSKLRWAALLLVSALASGACEQVTPDAIELWKGTVKGPGKLQNAVENESIEVSLRAQAVVALEDIQEGGRIEAALNALPRADAHTVALATVPLYLNRAEAEPRDIAPARNGLMRLRPFVNQEHAAPVGTGQREPPGSANANRNSNGAARDELDAALLRLVSLQLRRTPRGTGTLGGHTLARVVEAVGAPSAPVLMKLLQDPRVDVRLILGLLDKIASTGQRDHVARLILAGRLPNAGDGEERLDLLSQIGGPVALRHLTDRVRALGRDAREAAQALRRRVEEKGPEPELAALAVQIARNAAAPGLLREEMFALAETCCGDATQEGLIQIVAESPEPLVRYRAFEAAVAAGGSQAVQPALEAFPVAAVYTREDVVDFLVRDLSRRAGARELWRKSVAACLGSPKPLARLVALLVWESLGSGAPAGALGELVTDEAVVKGFGGVGAEARRVASALRQKRRNSAGN